jgi:hypothetical protein
MEPKPNLMIRKIKSELTGADSPFTDLFTWVCFLGTVLVGSYYYYEHTHRPVRHEEPVAKIPTPATVTPLALATAQANQTTQTSSAFNTPMAAAEPVAPMAAPMSVQPVSSPAPAPETTVATATFQKSPGSSIAAILEPSASAETVQPSRVMGIDIKAPTSVPQKRISLGMQITQPKSKAKPKPLTEAEMIQQAANEGFDRVMNFAQNYPDAYGFAPGESLEQVKLGNAIPVYTIAANDRLNYQSGQPVKPILKTTGDLLFPVLLNGEARYIVTVKKTAHGYTTGDGSKALAMVYEKILNTWPASAGYHPQIVRQPGIPNYYFTVPELPEQNLTDTSCMFTDSPVLSPASVILASWR